MNTALPTQLSDSRIVSEEELLERVHALAPKIKARAAECAANREPHAETIQELVDAGIVQMLVPRRWGGTESGMATLYEVIETISRACPSTGWIASFYIIHNIYVTKYPEETQEELLGEKGYVLMPACSAPNMKAEKVEGGWRISGRAVWGSGIMHADWVQVSGDAEGQPRGFLLKKEDCSVQDVWDYTGMSGTGSNDFIIDNVFVPEHHSIPMIPVFAGMNEHAKIHPNGLYSLPFFMSAFCTILPVLTGSLAGAIDAYTDITEKRIRNFSGAAVKDQQYTHLTLGEFDIMLNAAQTIAKSIYSLTEEIIDGRECTIDNRIFARGQTSLVAKICRDTANQMMSVAGASNYHNDKPLQRIWRDLNMVCSHAFWDWDVSRELIGRQHLGLEPNFPLV